MNTKKTYKKPEVAFVDFTLSASIAQNCVYHGTYSSIDSCGYRQEGSDFTIFANACTFPTDEEFCYHNPTADQSVFSS